MIKLSYSFLKPGDIVNVTGFQDENGLEFEGSVRVESPPFSLTPVVLISGPTELRADAPEVCWDLGALRTGGRGVVFDASRSDPVVANSLTQKSGMSGERLCVESQDWENFDSGESYTLTVDSRSNLFGTTGSGSLTFFVQEGRSSSRSVPPSKKRQQELGCADLWNEDPLSVYGIRTYPSGSVYLASSVRLDGLTVLLKALTPCEEVEMSKEILESGNVSWRFGDQPGLDANEYSVGTRLFLPASLLQSTFPPSDPVEVTVLLDLEEGVSFSSSFTFQFVAGPVEFVLSNDPGSAVVADSPLVLNFEDSLTEDQERKLVGSLGLEWEWGWGCVNPVTGDACQYRNGDELVMPGKSTSMFESDGDFSVAEPLLFVVHAKVTSSDGWVSRGKWSRIFSPVDSVPQFQLEFSEWRCLFGEGQYGYNFQIPPELQSGVRSTKFESLLSEDPDDFGSIRVFNIEDSSGVAQFRCSCDSDCSEPMMFRLTVEYEGGDEMTLHGLFEPKSALPPRGGTCESFFETNEGVGSGDSVVSGLSFVVVRCGGWLFSDGDISVVGQRVFYQSDDGAEYPRNQTVFGPIQFTVPCGSVAIVSEVIGLGESGNTSTRFEVGALEVASWSNGMEDLFTDVQRALLVSPNQFLETAHLYSTLKTMVLSCFPDGTFVPLDAGKVLDDILGSDPPDTVEDVLDEALIIGVVVDPDKSDEVFDRYEDYLEVVGDQGDLEDGDSLSESIVDGVSGLFGATDDEDVRDNGYGLLGDVQTTLLCLMECGEDPVLVEGDLVTVGAQSGTLEQLAGQPIALGDTGASFIFPSDISELQESLGEGTCVYTGTSFVEPNDASALPAASFTFYTINCTTGEREEVIVTLDGEFVIVLPLPDGFQGTDTNTDCGAEEPTTSCVSGDTLSALDDTIGCRVIEVQEDQIVCGCTHLTAFSALFAPGLGGVCGGWEWSTLQTVAATLIAFSGIFVLVVLVVEHFLVYKKRKAALKSKTRRRAK